MKRPKNIKETIARRNKICQSLGIKIIKVFDTNEHESNKDVVLGDWQGRKVVVRVGECRPKNFFPQGFRGRHMVIPRVYLINTRIPYEIEEYLKGPMFCEIFKKPGYNKLFINNNWLKKIIQAHWEFQKVAAAVKLPLKIKKISDLNKFFCYAGKLIPSSGHDQIRKIFEEKCYKIFWQTPYPSKWKYSRDNLLALPDYRVGLIDLMNVGRRHWGYDLGWLFWAQWFDFKISDYQKSVAHYKHLEYLFSLVWQYAPSKEKKDKPLFDWRCRLVIFERIIGGLYDLGASISHTRKMTQGQKRAMAKFLNQLLEINLNNINKYN
ncbi:MAG: hypothetical protein ABIH91_00605 [Candidatus Omnitrophota bacterium]